MSSRSLLPEDTLDLHDARVCNGKGNILDEVLHVTVNRANTAGFTCHICPEAELRQITVDGLLVRFNFEVWSFMEAFPHAVKDGCAAFFGDAQKSVDALSPDLFENRLVVRIWNLLAAPWPPSVVSLYSATECRFSSNAGTSFGSPWVKRWLTVHPLVPGWLS
jgi:hypothetical protein